MTYPRAGQIVGAATARPDPEVDRMVRFRDWLRTSEADRRSTNKARLATRGWKYMQQYADAKTGVVDEILTRAIAH